MIKNKVRIHNGLFLILFMVIAMLFAGCSNSDDAEQTTEENTESSTEQAVENQEVDKGYVVLATTTSTQDSGLLDELVPIFEEQTGYMVKTIAVGTGKALEMGENGEADVLLVHAPAAEKPLVDQQIAINYQLVMHNDFILVGPPDDPAGVKETTSPSEALKKIAENEAIFISRGDDSGTHKKELGLWEEAGLEPAGQWYQETGQGMGGTLRVASEKEGYTLTDRATYLALKDELALDIVLQGDESLLNIYHVMQVNPEKFENINADAAKAFVDFLIAPETQQMIGEFGVEEYGEPLFFPDAETN